MSNPQSKEGRTAVRLDTTERPKIREATLKMAAALAREIGEHKVVDDPDILESVSGDESHCERSLPDIAVRVAEADDVVKTLRLADKFGVPVTPRAGGTGKAGGAIPVLGGAVLDTSRMNRIHDIQADDLTAVVEPGCVLGDFHKAVEDEGLFYPPDPNSLETCCLGGNAAHNAGGPRAFKYGVTREYVRGMDLVLMGGASMCVGCKTVKSVAGYDLVRLLVGSEGTLGVFTKLVMRLTRKPTELATLLVLFEDEVAAGRAIPKIIEKGLVPRVMEFMDEVLVETLRMSGVGNLPEGAGALLLTEFDGSREEVVEDDVALFADVCEAAGAQDVLMARHVGERNQLWAGRRGLSDAIANRVGHKIAEDVVVPRSQAAALLEGLRELKKKHGILIASYGHAGDGNYHVNVLWDDDDWDPWPAVEDVFRLVLSLGGSITGEHGIGLAKKRYLVWEKGGDQIEIQRRIKAVFDPKGLMNPGKIF